MYQINNQAVESLQSWRPGLCRGSDVGMVTAAFKKGLGSRGYHQASGGKSGWDLVLETRDTSKQRQQPPLQLSTALGLVTRPRLLPVHVSEKHPMDSQTVRNQILCSDETKNEPFGLTAAFLSSFTHSSFSCREHLCCVWSFPDNYVILTQSHIIAE